MKSKLSNWKWLPLVALGFSAFGAAGQNLPPPVTVASAAPSNAVPAGSTTNALPAATGTGAATNVLSAAEQAHVKYVHETIARLISLEMNNDPESLAAILAEMKNSDKEIRTAALKSVVQFNDRSAIPALQKIADETADPFEKVDILKAIDYIKLPSLTEVMAYKRALKAAKHHQTNAPPVLPAGTNNLPPAAVHP